MKDPCRICGVRAVGSQCRWIFSSAAKRKLQVILSHVLGWEVTRDGRGEFLCGKCVFQLEKVVQCDVDISQLQDEHNSHIQKLQGERDHLIQCIVHTYNKNNPSLDKSDVERVSLKNPLRSSGVGNPDDEAAYPLTSDGLGFKESRSGHMENRMKRCVSLDHIATKASCLGRPGSMKSFGLRSTRHHSQSMYLDLLQRKGMLPRSGIKGRSTSLQSLNRDFSSETPPDFLPKLKVREPKVVVARHGAADDPRGMNQARALLRSSSNQPSVISDLIQLLRCISKKQISPPAGSHIPILKGFNCGPLNPRSKHRLREAEWKSLHDLTEEFDDKYTPVRVKVVVFSNANWEKRFYTATNLTDCCLPLLILNIFSVLLSAVFSGFA